MNPARGMFYIVSKDHPAMLKLDPDGEQQAPPPDEPGPRGRYLYDVHCHRCHSIGEVENPRAVSSLAGIAETMSDRQIANVILDGRGPMPGFPSLSTPDTKLLTAFVKNPAAFPAAQPVEQEQLADSARFVSGFGLMRASNGLSPIGPPWSTLTAYDLNEGTIKWQIPLGDVPELAAKGVRNTGSSYPKVGPALTAGGLIFTGTRDKKIRGFDERTGEILWEHELDAALEGIPAVYAVDGRQYVLFCAAAQVGLTRETEVEIKGAYVAFALPE